MISDRPLVSVVIPTWNNASLVIEAVDSVLAQTYSPVEIVVVDDGSTDDTVERLEKYGSRVTVVRQTHSGPAVARNAGIRASSGELVAFLDSDDIWMPTKLERCVPALFADENVGAVYTDVRVLDRATGAEQYAPCYRVDGRICREMFLECRGVSLSAFVTRRRCLEEVGLFDEALFRAQDWDLFIRLAEQYEYRFVPEVLTVRRTHERQLSVTRRDLYREYNLKVIEKSVARRPDLYAPLLNDSLSRAYFRFGMQSYGDFDMRRARRDFARSFRLRPNAAALNYLLRTFLPVRLAAALRRFKQSRRERHA